MGNDLCLRYCDEFDVHSHSRMNLREMGRVGSTYCLIRMNLSGMGRVGSNYSLVYVIEIRITFMFRI